MLANTKQPDTRSSHAMRPPILPALLALLVFAALSPAAELPTEARTAFAAYRTALGEGDFPAAAACLSADSLRILEAGPSSPAGARCPGISARPSRRLPP